MKYLSSWLRAAGGQTGKKVRVKVKRLKLEGIVKNSTDEAERMAVVVVMKWKGPGFYNKRMLPLPFRKWRKNYTSPKLLKKGEVEWDEEFGSVCSFLIGSKYDSNRYSSWHVSFKILYGEDAKAKTKLTEMGKVSLNIAELVSSIADYEIKKKLPVSVRIAGVSTQATLSICISFAQVESSIDSLGIVQKPAESLFERPLTKMARTQSLFKTITHSNNDQVSSQNWNETTQPDSANLSASDSPTTRKNCNSDLKIKAWKKKSWSFTLSKMKREPLIEEINSKLSNPHNCSSSWEVKELVSRDGQTKLKAEVFFASFDQRSAKAAGESACAAMVAVVAHWLQSNQDSMPTTSQFDSLITEGSSEWRKLCNNDEHVKSFPDNHFDLETVLKAELRPLNILPNKSFTGIFSPEKFENLKGAMSFDDIWDEIRSITEEYDQRIYIVSWNDHFFVLKADFDAYYIIDSLGERLFEGCNQAYILKFDESTLMHGKVAKEEINSETTEANNEVVICKGKECCKEFIKRFLAAIPIMELAEQEKKERVSTFSLLQRLQIDFHYCCSSSPSSMASPTSSLFSTDEGIN